jgi:hypothetical protein
MNLLHEVDKPGSDVEEYIMNLDEILKAKMDMIHIIRSQVSSFYDNIKEEQELSQVFHGMQTSGDIEPPHDNMGMMSSPLDMEDNLLEGDDMLMDEISDELGGFKITDN